VDPHTHALFAGDRRSELRRRLGGAAYADIAAEGGGILSTVRATRAATEDELVAATRPRLGEMLRCGTTTCEVKSGYGLTVADEACAESLAAAGVVATLLPAAAFYLKLGRFAAARMFVEHGVAVALATDVNPGGGFSPSMPFVIALACFAMGLTFEEALVGATINAAYALDRHGRVGSLEVGKDLDAVVVAGPAIDLIRVGADVIRIV